MGRIPTYPVNGMIMILIKIAIALGAGLVATTILSAFLTPVIGLALGAGVFWFVFNKML